MRITLYKGAKNPDPLDVHDFTWDELCSQLAEAVNTPPDAPETATAKRQKEALLAFAPHELHAGQSRSNAAVKAVTALVIDVDRCDSGALCSAIETLGVAAFVYESPSSPNEDGTDRVRVVCPTSRDMTPEECDPLRLVFAEMVGLDPEPSGVAGALGAARIFFLGRLHGTPERDVWRNEGAPLDVDAFLSARGEVAPAKPFNTERSVLPIAPADEIGAVIGAHDSYHGRRHDLAGALGGELRKLGVSRGRADVLGSAWLGRDKWDEHGSWFMGAYGKDAAEVSGRAALAEIVGEEKAEAFAKSFAPFKGAAPRGGSAGTAGDGVSFTTWGEFQPLTLSGANGQMWIHYEGTYKGPYAHRRMRSVARACGLIREVCETADGKSLPYDAIFDAGTHVESIVRAFSDARTWFDVARGELHMGYVLPMIAPAFDSDVDAWLRAVAGEQIEPVLDWIRSCAQDCIHRKAACLTLIGAPGIGKTKLPEALAALWGEVFVPLKDSVAQFNSTIARCPIVVDDECAALKSRDVTSSEFRQRVQATTRDFEPKGKEKVRLVGATREVITANALEEVRFADVRGAAVAQALEDRLLVVEAGVGAKAALLAVRGDGNDATELARIVGHLAWIWATREAPGEARFIGAAESASRSILALNSVAEEGALVWDHLSAWLDSNPRTGDLGGAWAFRDGKLLVCLQRLASQLALKDRLWDLPRVTRVLAPLELGRVRTEDVRWRVIDLDRAQLLF